MILTSWTSRRPRLAPLALLALFALLPACQGESGGSSSASPPAACSPEGLTPPPDEGVQVAPPEDAEEDAPESFAKRSPEGLITTLEALAPSLPEDVFLLMVFENSGISRAVLDATEGLFIERRDDDAFAEDLNTLMRTHFGVDLTGEAPLIVAVSPPPSNWFGLFSATLPEETSSDSLTTTPVGSLTAFSYKDEAVYRVALEDIGVTGVFFSLDHLAALDAIRGGQGPASLAGTPQLDTFKQLFLNVGLGQITLAAQFSDPTLAATFFDRLPLDPLDGLSVALDRRILASALGPKAALSKLSGLFTLGKMQLNTRLTRKVKSLDEAPIEEATSTLLSFHLLEAWSRHLHPRLEDGALFLEMPGLEPAESLALVGFFAAIALPAMLDLLNAP